MSKELAHIDQAKILEKVLIAGDTSTLTPEQKVGYLQSLCDSMGLNPLSNPFKFITMNGKQVCYASRDCTDQLRKVQNVSLKIVSRETFDGVYVVTAQATLVSGRTDESTGAVTINGLRGDALANAMMKAETKAKRRVTLSICGLGFLDESEVETLEGKQKLTFSVAPEESPPQTVTVTKQFASRQQLTELKKVVELKKIDPHIASEYSQTHFNITDPRELSSAQCKLMTVWAIEYPEPKPIGTKDDLERAAFETKELEEDNV